METPVRRSGGSTMPLNDITQSRSVANNVVSPNSSPSLQLQGSSCTLGRTTSSHSFDLGSSGNHDENVSPSRGGLRDLFNSVQVGSLKRKGLFKASTVEDSDTSGLSGSVSPQPSGQQQLMLKLRSGGTKSMTSGSASILALPAMARTGTSTSKSTLTAKPARQVQRSNLLRHHSLSLSKPQIGFTSSLARRSLFGPRPCLQNDVSLRFHMKTYINTPQDTCSFVSEDETTLVPPFSCAYNTFTNHARNLAVGDEDGTIHIVDTLSSGLHSSERTPKIRACKNAIFDLTWTANDTRILSASGDQMVRCHDVETGKLIGTFAGHTGSIKSISKKYQDNNIFATAARDGTVMVWDIRCSGTLLSSATNSVVVVGGGSGETQMQYRPANKIVNAHKSRPNNRLESPTKKMKQHGAEGPNTASAVQFLMHNDNLLASTGASDGTIKYWDTRQHGSYLKYKDNPIPVMMSTPNPAKTFKRSHGIASMALSPDGSTLYAASSDNHIYQYAARGLGSPLTSFSGEKYACSSYYIKIRVSPDNQYLASGSNRGLYVWETNSKKKGMETKPLVFQGHESEVTAVDWAPINHDYGSGTGEYLLSGCSDDATVRTWRPDWKLVEQCREEKNESLKHTHGLVVEESELVGTVSLSSTSSSSTTRNLTGVAVGTSL